MGTLVRAASPFLCLGLLCLGLLCLGLQAGAAGPQETPTFKEELQVREVLLDVVVTDEEGNVILGLEADDFLVEEDGEPVAVESVSFYSNRRFLGLGAGAESDAPPADRYFVLTFYRPPVGLERNNRLFLQLPEAGKRAFEWVTEELLPNDHVAVVGFGTSLKLYHDFSRDRRRLGRAIHQAATGKKPDERWPSRTEEPQEGITLRDLAQREELSESTATPFDALRVLADELGTVRGRKNVVLFGFDFPAVGSTESRQGYEPMLEALNDSNAAVYAIGVTRQGFKPSLEQVTQDTGGEYLFSFQDYIDPLRHIARQNSGYYLLSYRTEIPPEGEGYREVKVSTQQEGLNVRSRGGYRYGS